MQRREIESVFLFDVSIYLRRGWNFASEEALHFFFSFFSFTKHRHHYTDALSFSHSSS